MVNGDVTKDSNDKGAIGGGIYDVDDDKEWETLSGTVRSYMRRGSRRQHSAMRKQGSNADRVRIDQQICSLAKADSSYVVDPLP
jgi:hypothetical protein